MNCPALYGGFILLIKQMAKKQGVTEKCKATNQLEWVSTMNNIRTFAEEIMAER